MSDLLQDVEAAISSALSPMLPGQTPSNDLVADALAAAVVKDPGVQVAIARLVDDAARTLTGATRHESPNVPADQPRRDGCACALASCGHCRKYHTFGGKCSLCGCETFI